MKKHANIPDFLVIGVGKSGTTSLNNYLRQHPQIFIPKRKEPNFFGYETVSPNDIDTTNPGEINQYNFAVRKIDEYLNLFAGASRDQIIGETSNLYLKSHEARDRIFFYNPGMKLTAILRHPAERLYSRYLHLAREERLPSANFKDCFDRSSVWWKRNDLITEGFYFEHLNHYFQRFPAQQLHIILYEDFVGQPAKVLADLYKFLQVDDNFKADLSIKYNESGYIRSQFLNRIYGQKSIFINAARELLPQGIMDKLKSNMTLQRSLNKIRKKNLLRPDLPKELRSRLIQEVYQSDIERLQDLIQKDLSTWLS